MHFYDFNGFFLNLFVQGTVARHLWERKGLSAHNYRKDCLGLSNSLL